jgi:SAM-dependent methyltransferase
MNAKNPVAGDFDYDTHGQGYARQRRADPRIAAQVHAALGDARTILNVGAGAGSYEPLDRHVIAIEPSAAMRAQRPKNLTPAIRGIAEELPLDDQSVDAAMAMVTIHQWKDAAKGLAEMRRVTCGPILILTFDGDALDQWWLAEYAPELLKVESKRYPKIDWICNELGSQTEVKIVQIPIDCVDGFTEAFYARPERMLEAAVRKSQSAWGFVDEKVQEQFARKLEEDLKSGAWEKRHGHLRKQPYFEGSLRLIVSQPAGRKKIQ